jgi:hypothetical protein
VKRQWFRDEDDGGFYRNCPLIRDDMDRALRRGRLLLHRRLAAEWQQAWTEGVISKPSLGRGDVAVEPAPFREAYPDRPGLWRLDER